MTRETDIGEYVIVLDGEPGDTAITVAIHHPKFKSIVHQYGDLYAHALDRYNDIVKRMALQEARKALGLKATWS